MVAKVVGAAYCFFVVGLIANPFVHGQVDSTWNNTTGNWSDSSKWSTAQFPDNGNGGLDYNVIIPSGNITLDSNILIESLLLTSGTLDTDGFDLMMIAPSQWNSGTLTSPGSTSFVNGLTLSGTTKTLNDQHILNNLANTFWSAGNFNSGSAATFNNLSGAIFETDFDGSFSYNLGGVFSSFNNAGMFIKSGGTGTTQFSAEFNNSGIVSVGSGTLNLFRGTSSGAFVVDAGGTLAFSSAQYDIDTGSSISGDGNVNTSGTFNFNAGLFDVAGTTLISGGTANFNADAMSNNVVVSSGVRTGIGTLTSDSLFEWTGGSLTGTGTTQSDGTLDLSGTTHSLNEHIFNNAGTATWTAGNFNTGSAASFNNLAGATLDTDFDGSFSYNLGGIVSSFNNDGTFTKSGGTGITSFSTDFNNTGIVNINSGTLRLFRSGTNTGTFDVGSAGTLEFIGGTPQFAAGASVSGPGDVRFSGGTVTFESGTYTIAGTTFFAGGTAEFNTDAQLNDVQVTNGTRSGSGLLTASGLFEWTGGSLTGTGTTQSDGTLELSGATHSLNEHIFNNAGTATWTAGNFNTGSAASFNNLAGATLETDFDGSFSYNLGGIVSSFNNDGTFTKSGGTGLTSFSTDFNNTGIVNINSGTLRLFRSGTNTGAFDVGSAGTLEFFGGTPQFAAGASVSGPGDVRVSGGTVTFESGTYTIAGTTFFAGGTAEFNTDAQLNDVQVTSGTRSGSGVLTASGLFEWTGGSLTGTGTTQSDGTLELSGSTHSLAEHIFNNSGTATWTAGNFNTGSAASFNNLAGATLETDFDGSFSFNLGGIVSSFNNDGIFTKSGGIGITSFSTDFSNTGIVNINSGTLRLFRGMTQAAGTTFLGGGNLSANQPIEFTGGSVSGNGTITANVNVTGGTIAPGDSIGELTFDGATTSVVNDSVIEIEIGSVTGVPGTDWDFMDVTGVLRFDDNVLPSGTTLKLITLDAAGNPGLLDGFDPASQYSFTIASASSITGFDCSQFTFDLSEFANSLTGEFLVGVDTSGPNETLVVNYSDFIRGDVNQDGVVNLLDVAPFVTALTSGQFIAEADTNCDGVVNLLDVSPFVEILAG